MPASDKIVAEAPRLHTRGRIPRPNKKIIKIRPYTFRKDYPVLSSSDARSQAVVFFGIFASNEKIYTIKTTG